MKKYLLTSALPYANGNIHIGHLVEYIQTDIFARFQRVMGNDIYYFCAVDAHGTPITLNAKKQNVSPEEMVERYMKEDLEDFNNFQIQFDSFYTTHSPENKEYAEFIYNALKENGDISKKNVDQMYCEKHGMFLPDRFVRGTCPKCGADEQYGDVCESCNSTYSPSDLKNPQCYLCGNKPVIKNSIHYFFTLSKYQERLKKWILEEVTIKEDEKYFYVWLDAPVGYISTAKKYSKESGVSFDELWHDEQRKIIHVIGKDIIYFHSLFWPAMLMGSGFSLPDRVQVHGMLTVNGEKMSKSRGTFINARSYLKFLDPQYLRFYYASKLSSSSSDLDLNFDDFLTRVNADLINNLVNVASRSMQFLEKRLGGKIGKLPLDSLEKQKIVLKKVEEVCAHFDEWEFGKGISEICAIADIANKYFQESTPWAVIKEDEEKTRSICTFMINCVKIIGILIKPVLPEFSEKIEKILLIPPQNISDAKFNLEECCMGKFEKLIDRVEKKKIDKLIKDSMEDLKKKDLKTAFPPIKEEITIEDFAKIDLRVAQILEAKEVEGADKLLELKLDIGIEKRTVFAGIKKAYDPEKLVGKKLVLVANLKPRKMRFGVSEGMILAGSDDSSLILAQFDGDVLPGAGVK